MLIENIFTKDIFRPINGVVKADQLDEGSVWQELEEFVVTKELYKHLDRFFSRYCHAIDNDDEPNAEIGVWVSGFFGSGKSHFIKVLSYLLANKTHTYDGMEKRAVHFFESKITDAMLFGDIQRAVAADTDVVLFNIDSKADNRAGREAILAVFLRVLNEMQGFSGDHAHIAHMERYLAGRNKLGEFKNAFRSFSDKEWEAERDAYEFNRDEVVKALAHTLGQSPVSCEKWVDGAEENFSLTIENFAKWVRGYIDSRGPNHRIIFLADEVGQFIGTDAHLMLNLQTIAEELGTLCQGRAWIVVTSQEDIDAVLGDLSSSRSNDFSKIQGRFKTRLSLSSANVDEVIQERLLAKRGDAKAALEHLFAQKGDIIRHQLTFKNVGMTFKQVRGPEDFVTNYPFAPYQFQLLQKIFESIRKAGATGLHLAQGERSLLDAFQYAAKAVAGSEIGVAVPLYLFYPPIESFLDTAVKRTIDHARENDSLEDFDSHVLEVLFLIRYVDEMKGNIDNLVTLCLDHVDADRLALRRKIEASLQRLEQETLISRAGDSYFFLTNEERDINREIKSVELVGSEDSRLLGELIYADVLRDQRKHRFADNKMDFSFNRICDQIPYGSRLDGALGVSVISPLADEYETYQDGRCILESSQEGGQVLIRLGDHDTLGRELRTYIKTDKYLRTKDDGTLLPSTRRVHRDLADENRARRERLTTILEELLAEASYFANGQRLSIKASAPIAALDEALDYLVRNSFTKMGYLQVLTDNPLPEIQGTVRADDISQGSLDVELPEYNPQAIADLRQYIELATKTSRQIVLSELIHKRYALRPYGWPNLEVVLLLARLYALGEIHFEVGGYSLERDKVYDAITTPARWAKVVVHQRVVTPAEDRKKARQLGQQVFAEMGPDNEEGLYGFLRGKAESWRSQLSGYKSLAETGNYPGEEQISNGLSLLKPLLAADESNKFLERFLSLEKELLELAERFHDLEHFYEHQRPTWEQLRAARDRFQSNRLELERADEARIALQRMDEILGAPEPYGLIHETAGLVQTVDGVNSELIESSRAEALADLDAQLALVRTELDLVSAGEDLRQQCLEPFEQHRRRLESLESLAHFSLARAQALEHRDRAMALIRDFATSTVVDGPDDEPAPTPPKVVRPATFAKKPYLENKGDARAFLDELKRRLEKALENGGRVEIR